MQDSFIHIVPRHVAKTLGLRHYFTGKPCKHGHVDLRVLAGKCCECHRLGSVAFHEKHRERLLADMKIYTIANKESAKIRKARERLNRLDAISAYMAAWRSENNDLVIAQQRAWRAKNPDAHKGYAHKRRAMVTNAGGSFTQDDIRALYVSQKKKCASCLNSIVEKYHIDHIMPIILGGDNSKYNLQLLCPTCNLKKHAKDPIDWAQKNGRLL